MSNEDQETLNALTERLNRLTLERNEVIEEINTLRPRIVEGRHTQRNNRVDANGTHLHLGDRVRFLTQGRYQTTQGTIVKFGSRFVVSLDNKGNKIAREYRNVEKIEEDDD